MARRSGHRGKGRSPAPKELESRSVWAAQRPPDADSTALIESIGVHLSAARDAAPARRRFGDKAAPERAISNLDAAETMLLNVAPAEYLQSRFPGVLTDVGRPAP